MSEKTNTTVHGTIKDAIKMQMKNEMLYGTLSPHAKWVFQDDSMSERHEDLLEKFPSKDIGDIRKLENTLKSYSDSLDDDIVELCLENDITSSVVLLMDVLFENNLRTASRNGITLMMIDGSMEIRDDGREFLSPEEIDMMREYLVDEDDYVPFGYAGVDKANEVPDMTYTGNTKTFTPNNLNFKVKNGIESGKTDEVKNWLSEQKEVSFEVQM